MIETQRHYGLVANKTGELIKLETLYNSAADYQYKFSTYESDPIYKVDDRITAEKARLFNPSSYMNSSEEMPYHGALDLSEYRVVVIEETIKVTPTSFLPEIKTFGKELVTIYKESPITDKVIAILDVAKEDVSLSDLYWREHNEYPEKVDEIQFVSLSRGDFLKVTLIPYKIEEE